MDILLIPCIIFRLIFDGRDGSFFLKKYPPTSPNEKKSLHVFFLSASCAEPLELPECPFASIIIY